MEVGKTGLIRRYSEEQWIAECKRRRLKNELKEIKQQTVSVKKTILRKNNKQDLIHTHETRQNDKY
jgi:hypothetical protein